jgi:hypothetical protein
MKTAMADGDRSYERACAIVTAARQYRDAMRRHLAMQAETTEDPERFDALVGHMWLTLRETERTEEALFALLDALDAH